MWFLLEGVPFPLGACDRLCFLVWHSLGLPYIVLEGMSSIEAGLEYMTSQNGGQDGRHGSKMAAMAQRWPTPIQDGVQDQIRVMTSDDPVTRSVSPRKVS